MTFIPNSHYKDTLFRAIFGKEEHKDWLLSLYNALNNSHYTNINDITLTTIEGVIYITMKNDVSFLIDSEMTLIEQQSSYNPNMPLRGLFYFAELYQEYLVKNEINILSTTLKKIPTPKFVVFYNGNRKTKEKFDLKLSDAFEKPLGNEAGTFEWTATVYNINAVKNATLNKKCKPLYDYCRFVSQVKQNITQGLDKKVAIEEAVNWAIEQNLLDGYFAQKKAEVIGMYLHEFNQELFETDIRSEGYQEGFNKGISQGIAKQKAEDEKLIKRAVKNATAQKDAQLSSKNAEIQRLLEENARLKAKL